MEPLPTKPSSSSSSTTTTLRRSSEAERIEGKGNMGGGYQDSSILIGDGKFVFSMRRKTESFKRNLGT